MNHCYGKGNSDVDLLAVADRVTGRGASVLVRVSRDIHQNFFYIFQSLFVFGA